MNHLINTSHVTYEFREVDGHSDDKKNFDYDKANQPKKRNIDMDKRAKAFLTFVYRHQPQ